MDHDTVEVSGWTRRRTLVRLGAELAIDAAPSTYQSTIDTGARRRRQHRRCGRDPDRGGADRGYRSRRFRGARTGSGARLRPGRSVRGDGVGRAVTSRIRVRPAHRVARRSVRGGWQRQRRQLHPVTHRTTHRETGGAAPPLSRASEVVLTPPQPSREHPRPLARPTISSRITSNSNDQIEERGPQ